MSGEKHKLRCIRHAATTLQSLNRCRKEGLLCDVTIVVGKETYLAHRYVLAVSSEYFRNLFSEDKKEEIVRIDDTEPEIIKLCIEFIYTGAIEVNDDNVRPLWKACSNLQLQDIIDRCAEYLLNEMNGKICLLARELAIEHGHEKLRKAADSFGMDNFNLICGQEEFLHLSQEDVMVFLAAKKNQRYPPPVIYDAVINWVHHDLDTRSEYFPKLLRFIKFNILPTTFLKETLRREPLFRMSHESRTELEQELFKRLYKKNTSMAVVLFDSCGEAVKAYNVITRKLCLVQSLEPGMFENCTALVMDEYIYVLKGSMGYRLNCGCKIADWTRIEDLPLPRASKIRAAVADGCIYVIGGKLQNEHRIVSVGEYYDTSDKTWCSIRDMPTARDGHVIVGHSDYLYCIGGYSQPGEILDTVERFDPVMGIWTSMEDRLNEARAEAVGLMHEGKIYILGGLTDVGEATSSVEMCDPVTGVWTKVSNMVHARLNFSAAIMNERLFVIGGAKEQEERQTVTIEMMNFEDTSFELYDTIVSVGRLESAIITEI